MPIMEDAIKGRIQANVDASGSDVLKAALGTPGGTVRINGDEVETGKAWLDGSAFCAITCGIGAEIDTIIIAKINELIDEFSQLIIDYDAETAAAHTATSASVPAKIT